MKKLLSGAALISVLFATQVCAQEGDGARSQTTVNIFKPQKGPATPLSMAAIKVPSEFKVTAFATGLKNIRIIAVAPNGDIYVSRRDQGDVLLLRDANKDGKADGAPRRVANRAGAHGLAIRDGQLYLSTVKEIFSAPINPDGSLGELKMLVGDLPDGGQHPNRTIAFGPDGMLYVSVGSDCNACNETNPEHATLLRMTPDGKTRVVFARGLRNTIGFAWHPATGELWGMDHGIDDLGDDQQPEELNRLEYSKFYGWPYIYGKDSIHPQVTPPGGLKKPDLIPASAPMVMGYDAHAAPMSMVFYSGGNFPAEYQGDAFVAMRGSWNRAEPSGYEVVRLRFKDGAPQGFEKFVTGFLAADGKTHMARPVGLAQASDGALLIADDTNGVMYRVAASAGAGAKPMQAPPADPMVQQTGKGLNVPLALARPETASARRKIAVTSPDFGANAPLPERFSEYADGVSPALSWTPVSGAKSYAIIVEDPDASPIKPFVHWVAWNIPGNVTSLPQGLPEQWRLSDPDGVMQGKTSKNTPAYMGPQPPVGDPPHHYHFQVLALNKMLTLPFGTDRDAVLAASQGAVIAKGEIVGTYAQTVKPPKSGQ